MTSIGIIANPASGKDIRRLVSHATIIDNHEKINMVKRIILGAQAFGVDQIYIMPDTYNTGYKALEQLGYSEELTCRVDVLTMKLQASLHDTMGAAQMMEELGVGCILVMGGDGTSRAVAKTISETPIISISTGTNNVYPQMVEGTVAGMAAAVMASGHYSKNIICTKDKRIEIYKNDMLVDIALIDAVISKNVVVGSKAIWNLEDMLQIVVSRAHPASIGFSAIVGCKEMIREEDDYGASISLTEKEYTVVAPLAAGVIQKIKIGEPKLLQLHESYLYAAEHNGMIAVDGEREVPFYKGEELTFKITREGPYRVNIRKAIEAAQKEGFFTISNSERNQRVSQI
ncbi:ATP-NAD kinase family protein [Bacillus tuaregi]|uniref:ATP-NAD kinase family protein n=1 Tax=Bacillus tuaregi TaxID=1816695 RepID=UPI0008F9097B|nr:NAD(+)/NADH kinase [Bacillus tuaregi]